MIQSTFHLAFPIKNLNKTKEFYINLLGCSTGRSTNTWIDINFFGNQLTAQVNPDAIKLHSFFENDKFPFPTHHFGVVLPWKDWHDLQGHLTSKNIKFTINPQTVFEGEVGEQKTMFIEDPDGYFIEFKTFENLDAIFKAV